MVNKGRRLRSRGQKILLGVGIGIGAVIVVFIVFIIVINIKEKIDYDQETAAGAASFGQEASAAREQYIVAATGTVQLWLDALAGGDAQAAVALMRDLPADQTFLTDETLRGAEPVFDDTQIESVLASESQVLLDVSFGMAGVDQTMHLSVANSDPTTPDGPWFIAGDTGTFSVDVDRILSGHADIGLVVNGVPAQAGATSISLFPGMYPLSVGDALFAFPEDDATLLVPVFTAPVFDFDLSADGQAVIDAAVTAKLDSCLAQAVAVPAADCGFGFENPVGVFERPVQIASVSWKVAPAGNDSAFHYQVDADTLVATASGHLTIQGDVTATDGLAYVGQDWITAVSVDLSDPADPVVTFD